MIIDILTHEQAFAANRQKYLEHVKGQHDLAMHLFNAYDAARPSTVEQIKRLAEVREETYIKRVIELEAEKKTWQDNSAANNSTRERER